MEQQIRIYEKENFELKNNVCVNLKFFFAYFFI